MTALPSKTGSRSVTGAALLAALAATLMAGAILPAQAQGYRPGYPVAIEDEDDAILPPRAVIFRLGRAGFTGMTHPRFDGETYRVEADSPWGNRVQLVVDARTGRILDRERLEAPLIPPGTVPGGRRPGYGWTEADSRPPWPRDEAFRDRAPRGNGWREEGPLRPRAELPPGDRPEERRVAARPLPQGAPQFEPTSPATRAAPAPRTPGNAGSNPLGLNPDSSAARTGVAPRREAPSEAVKTEGPSPRGKVRGSEVRRAPQDGGARQAGREAARADRDPGRPVPPLAPKTPPGPPPAAKARQGGKRPPVDPPTPSRRMAAEDPARGQSPGSGDRRHHAGARQGRTGEGLRPRAVPLARAGGRRLDSSGRRRGNPVVHARSSMCF